MGQEIDDYHFSDSDFEEFQQRLKAETELLGQWFSENAFDESEPVGGFELEAWLIDHKLRPAPINNQFLQAMDDDMVSPELARFNVEFNVDPIPLRGNALSTLAHELREIWQRGQTTDRQEVRLRGGALGARTGAFCHRRGRKR